jgi:hypothetical protein
MMNRSDRHGALCVSIIITRRTIVQSTMEKHCSISEGRVSKRDLASPDRRAAASALVDYNANEVSVQPKRE